MEIKEILTGLNQRQVTVSELIHLGQVLVKVNGRRRLELDNHISVQNLFETDETSISLGNFPDEGAYYPEHCHKGIIEYLICLKGSFGLSLPHNGYRILKEKECARIPTNVMHSVISLETDSEMLAICLPKEPGYTSCKGE